MEKLKKIRWVGSSREDLKKFPATVQDSVGYSLYEAKLGVFPRCAKPLRGFGGLFEIVCDFDKGTYRTVYATKIGNHIYVLHAFQKKSTIGIKTPKHEIDLMETRLKMAHLIADGKL